MPLAWEFLQLSYSTRVHPKLQLILTMVRYNLKLSGPDPSIWVKVKSPLAARRQVLHSDSMPVCHAALHSPKDPTGLCSWERIVKNVSIIARRKTFPFWRRALNSAGIAEYKSPVSGYYKDTQAQRLKSSYINIKIPHGGEASFSLTTHLKD